jgi:oligopeptide transport system permease protein
MATASTATATSMPTHLAETGFEKPELSYWADVKKRFFSNRLAIIGLVIFALLIVTAIVGPFIFRGNYTNGVAGEQLQRVFSKGHLLGTDDIGRDILRRVLRGLRVSLSLAFTVTIFTTFVAIALGGIAGYRGGWVDGVVSRLIDAMIAIPFIIIGIAFTAVFGASYWTLVLILLFSGWLSDARLFRASVLQVKSQDYIEAARATGASTKRILLNHVFPNALPPIIVSVAFSIANVVLAESIYAFLGIGFREPTPSIGVMIRSSRGQWESYPHLLLVPATFLVLMTLSIVFIGDGLRDALDPKLRGAE